jgi:hypothetical protein
MKRWLGLVGLLVALVGACLVTAPAAQAQNCSVGSDGSISSCDPVKYAAYPAYQCVDTNNAPLYDPCPVDQGSTFRYIVASTTGKGALLVANGPNVHDSNRMLAAFVGDGDAFMAGSGGWGACGTDCPGPFVSAAYDRANNGFWVFDDRGCYYRAGNARWLGSGVCGQRLNGPIVGVAVNPAGTGVWLVAADGGIFTMGDAAFHGSTGDMHLNKPVVGIAGTPTGQGYWLVAADGGIFSFGDAGFLGSMGATPLNKPVVGMVGSGSGYMMVAADGGVFNYGNAYYGSLGAHPPASPIVSISGVQNDSGASVGYWMLSANGDTYRFGPVPTSPS